VRAVDAEDRVAAALVEIHGAGAERVVDATFLHHGQDMALGGFAGAHFRRRRPGRPFGLAPDLHHARPAEAFASDADAVAGGPVLAVDEVEKLVVSVDDDGARLVARGKANGPSLVFLGLLFALRDENDIPCRALDLVRTDAECLCRRS